MFKPHLIIIVQAVVQTLEKSERFRPSLLVENEDALSLPFRVLHQ